MDPRKLEKIPKSTSISDKHVSRIKMDNPLIIIGANRIKLSLSMKVLTTKLVNREGFKRNMSSIWVTKEGKSIESLEDNKFICFFTINEDKRRIMAEEPWHYDNSLLVLEEPKGIGDVSKLRFNRVVFWVQILNIPILCMNQENALFIGKRIGKVLNIDKGSNGQCLGKFLKLGQKSMLQNRSSGGSRLT